MAKGDLVAVAEDVVRALYVPLWDEATKRASTQAFMQKEVSVSRPAVLPYERIVDIFKHDLNPVDGSAVGVVATGTLSVGQVLDLCADGDPPPPVVVAIVEDPVEAEGRFLANPSHALIQGWDRPTRQSKKPLTRGMANRLRKACVYRAVE